MIVEYEQIRLDLVAMEKPIEELGIALDIDGAKENIAKLTDIGVDYISSGALTHSAPILDLSLKNLHAL